MQNELQFGISDSIFWMSKLTFNTISQFENLSQNVESIVIFLKSIRPFQWKNKISFQEHRIS